MKNSVAALLLLYYSFGQIALPEGNFAYLAQIPDLYREFAAINDDADVDDFFEEQFFDFDRLLGNEDDDDPYEKETKQVPFHALPLTALNFCTASEKTDFIVPSGDKKKFTSFYLLTEYFVESAPIFHPPKTVSA